MTAQLRINGKVVAATEFAFDGCHKIYLISSAEDRAQLVELGWDAGGFLPVSELPRVWGDTCPLRFISSGDLATQYVAQGDPEPTITFLGEERGVTWS